MYIEKVKCNIKRKKSFKVGRSDLLGEGEFCPAAEVLRKLTRKHACITIEFIFHCPGLPA
jgi:hypothetical protein